MDLRPLLLALAVALGGCAMPGDTATPSGDDADGSPSPTADAPPTTPPGDPSPTAQDDHADDDPSFRLRAEMTSGDGWHRIDAVAENGGNATYQVEAGCSSPWRLQYEDPAGQQFQPRRPAASCQGFELVPFSPGQTISAMFWWNETRWDAQAGEVRQAEDGTYTWTVSFVAWRDEGTAHTTLELVFSPVVA